MAKKKPVTHRLADQLTEIEAQVQAIVGFEAHERKCVQEIDKREQQMQKLSRELGEWNRALADTRSLLRAQREKLERDNVALRVESHNLEGAYCSKHTPFD